MRLLFIILLWSFGLLRQTYIRPRPHTPQILVFSKTAGFHHQSIPIGIKAIRQLATQAGYKVTATENAALFSVGSLRAFDAVIFLNTTGDVLNQSQQQALKLFLKNGHGFMGVHAASDTEFGWPWYGKMIGAYFKNHPNIQQAKLHVVDAHHTATQALPTTWTRTDEWYNFRNIQPDIHVLVTLDENSYKGGENGAGHPITWTHNFDDTHVFYTGGGHTRESYRNPLFRAHLLGGMQYILEKEK